jgi:hypothetical protein
MYIYTYICIYVYVYVYIYVYISVMGKEEHLDDLGGAIDASEPEERRAISEHILEV